MFWSIPGRCSTAGTVGADPTTTRPPSSMWTPIAIVSIGLGLDGLPIPSACFWSRYNVAALLTRNNTL